MQISHMKTPLIRLTCLLLAGLALATAAVAEPFTDGKPLDPQPTDAERVSGLSTHYFFDYFNHIDELYEKSGGEPGEPIPNLNHVAFEDGKVLTTDRPMGVGAHIRGMIRFETAGTYVLKLQSNDGVRLFIGGVHLHTDPEIHAARWSPDLEYVVEQPGWYDFTLDYYQRKGTSALRMKWVPPGGEEEIVPESAFAHRP